MTRPPPPVSVRAAALSIARPAANQPQTSGLFTLLNDRTGIPVRGPESRRDGRPAASPAACHHERMRLDEEKVEALRSWGERLRQSGGEESAAVGRAILMLVEEIDRLHIELWHARMHPARAEPASTDGQEQVASSLHARLQRMLGRDAAAEPVEQPGSDTEPATSASAQAWIAALRRQK